MGHHASRPIVRRANVVRVVASAAIVALAPTLGCDAPPEYDVLIRGGTVYDGSGDAPFVADIGIRAIRSPRSATWASPPP